MSNIDSKPLENLARASLAQDRVIADLRAKLTTVTAERDALQAKLDAVPVEAIIAYRASSDESEGLIRYGDHEAHADFAQAMETLDAWIETQVVS